MMGKKRNKSELQPRRSEKIGALLSKLAADSTPYQYAIKPPELLPGVAPEGIVPPVLAMDSASSYAQAMQLYQGAGFPGFAYLSQLATRAEYRAFASAMSTEITREWIEFNSASDDGEESTDKIKLIEKEFARLNVRGVIESAAQQDCYFGRGQIFIDLIGHDRAKPMIIDKRTIQIGSLVGFRAVEAIWTTPSAYNSIDPAAPDFYRPSSWYMLGKEVHATRLMTVITRALPDILKPAFNFGGISLSQLAEPYVDNWLRTRQSVADLINNFSITGLATSMDQILQGDDGDSIIKRAQLFTAMRSNRGLMLLDKEREDIVQVNTPLSGLHELQAQSQEHMCAVSRIPAVILTGISPSGLNASSEGEIRVFYDWIAAQQEAYWRHPIEIMLKVVQLHLFGEIDDSIGFTFRPLFQMTPKEEAEIKEINSRTASAYVDRGVIDASEERERLAKDKASGYNGLDLDLLIVPPAGAGTTDPLDGAGDGDGGKA
jgi:phage-related protein (TIGR01555 family)